MAKFDGHKSETFMLVEMSDRASEKAVKMILKYFSYFSYFNWTNHFSYLNSCLLNKQQKKVKQPSNEVEESWLNNKIGLKAHFKCNHI